MDHPDRINLERAHQKAEELCTQVNEGVRENENSERLEWLQTHIIMDGMEENLIFNSETNCSGHRIFLHSGVLNKVMGKKNFFFSLFPLIIIIIIKAIFFLSIGKK